MFRDWGSYDIYFIVTFSMINMAKLIAKLNMLSWEMRLGNEYEINF